jgi:hypothetical protein
MTDLELLGNVLHKMIKEDSNTYIYLHAIKPTELGYGQISLENEGTYITEEEYQALLRAGVKLRGQSYNA